MKALLATEKEALQERPERALEASIDAIIRLTSMRIFAADLHLLSGDLRDGQRGRTLVHEMRASSTRQVSAARLSSPQAEC